MPIPMPRFPNCLFPGFFKFRMEKEFAIEIKKLHDFPYFLIIGLLTYFQLQQDKHYLAFTCLK